MSVSQTLPSLSTPLALSRRHALEGRALLWEGASGWQVLLTARNTTDHASQAWAGQLGLQLWHPARQVSVLLPTASTCFDYEIYVLSGESGRLGCYHGVCHALERLGITEAPPPRVLTDLHVHFVLSAMIGATSPASPS